MFTPSKVKFPIAAVKTFDEEARRTEYCKRCHHYPSERESVQPNVKYKYRIIDRHRLQDVCPSCNCWRYFDYYENLTGVPKTYNKSDWHIFKRQLFDKYPRHIATFLYKYCRGVLFCQTHSFHWTMQFTEEENKWLQRKLNELQEDLDCVDNERVADKSKALQRRRYRKQRDSGCCGSYDTEIQHPNGKVFLIGFHYGH